MKEAGVTWVHDVTSRWFIPVLGGLIMYNMFGEHVQNLQPPTSFIYRCVFTRSSSTGSREVETVRW